MITAKQLRRLLRFVILAGLAITLGLYLKTRQSPEKLTLQRDDRSMEPVYYAGAAVKARRVDRDFELRRGQDVLYAEDKSGFLGRVQGLPGDDIGVADGYITCNGELIGPRRIPAQGATAKYLAVVPANHVCILNINPDPQYSDSRQFGFVSRDHVQAIILGEIK